MPAKAKQHPAINAFNALGYLSTVNITLSVSSEILNALHNILIPKSLYPAYIARYKDKISIKNKTIIINIFLYLFID